MFDTIYQKLMILGFTETFIAVTLLVGGFFILLVIIKPIIRILIKYRCETLIAYFFSLFIILLISKDLIERYLSFHNEWYIYFSSLVTGLLTIRLMFKKIIQRS